MKRSYSRRTFVAGAAFAAYGIRSAAVAAEASPVSTAWSLSVHQYSLKKFFDDKTLDLLSLPAYVKQRFGITGVEYAAEYCGDLLDAPDRAAAIHAAAKEAGVENQVLLCAAVHPLDADSASAREAGVAEHLKWARCAEALGCHAMRVRATGGENARDSLSHAVDGIEKLCNALESAPVEVWIENIGGHSRNPEWLLELISRVGEDKIGLIADFGNFDGDIYVGMETLLPHTDSVCTKSWEFDADGEETKIDFGRMTRLMRAANFKGHVSIEYLGDAPLEGIAKTAALIQRPA